MSYVHKILPLDPMKTFCTLTIFKIQFDTILLPTLRFSKWSLKFRFSKRKNTKIGEIKDTVVWTCAAHGQK